MKYDGSNMDEIKGTHRLSAKNFKESSSGSSKY